MRVGGYELGEEIARGGTGAVFRARDRAGRAVAVKLLHSRNPVHLRRFLRETQALVRIKHPNVIRVHDVGESRGTPYLVMDLVEGESLQDRLERDGPLPGPAAARLLLPIARATEHAHESGILHRDIKPANILLPPDAEPILTDFGLARDLAASRSSLSKTGTFLGTPGYWPPEQARGELADLGPPSDVYALGATLYAMLTGQPPFTGDSLLEILGSTCAQPPTPPSQLVENVDRALERICLRCLEKDPGQRYPTAGDLAAALEDYLAGGSDSSAALPVAVVGLSGAIVVLVAVLAVITLRREPTAPTPQASSTPPTTPAAPADTSAPPRTALAALIARAEALDAKQDWPALRAVCDEALAQAPDHVEALRLRCRARAHQGDAPGALADIDRALTRAPRRGVLHMNRALCQLLLGQPREALDDFGRAIRYDPSNAKAYAGRALAKTQLQDLAGAVVDATAAIERDAELVQAWIHRGNAYHAKGTLEAAEADFTQAIALEPKNLQALHNRGMARVGQGRFKEAIDDFTQALRAHPTAGFVYASRGMAHERLQDDRAAVADYRAALQELPPKNRLRGQVRILLAGARRRLEGR